MNQNDQAAPENGDRRLISGPLELFLLLGIIISSVIIIKTATVRKPGIFRKLSKTEEFNPAGRHPTGRILIVYLPGPTGSTENICRILATVFQRSGMSIRLDRPISAPADISSWDLVIIAAPLVENGKPGLYEPLLSWIALSEGLRRKSMVLLQTTCRQNFHEPVLPVLRAPLADAGADIKYKSNINLQDQSAANASLAALARKVLNSVSD